jgi:two-component system phosphate regulon sensor histidine kinase PhoR
MRKDFVANVSHELRTPLTVIRGYLEVLEDSLPKGLKDQHLKALQQMQQQSLRMTTLINDLTMLSKLETDSVNKAQAYVPLTSLLEMICDEARAVSGDKHLVSLTCDKNIQLLGNERELHSAFSNLITNAVKYSPEGKAIEIRVSMNLANNLLVEIKDEGIGIEQQHISRLTERFYRVDSSRSIQTGGTGLGLAIVKHILLRHDGRLQIQSTYGQGSTFSCIFPEQRIKTTSTSNNTKKITLKTNAAS